MMQESGFHPIAIFAFIPLLINIALTIFAVYFVFKVISFMKLKAELDRERNQKLETLIRIIDQEDKLK